MSDRAALLYLTYNSEADVPHLGSFIGAAGQDLQVVAIDNASSDGSAEALRDLGLEPHIMQENVGFTAGINEGLSWLSEQDDFDWCVIANPDVRAAQRDWLPSMLDVPETCGVVGARLTRGYEVIGGGCVMDRPRPLVRPVGRPAFGGLVMCDELIGWTRLNQHVGGPKDFTTPREVPWVAFSLVALRLKMVREIGLLDDAYWHFVSDQELCFRAWSYGYAIRFNPVTFLHPGSTCLQYAPPEAESYIRQDLSRWCRVEDEYLRSAAWA